MKKLAGASPRPMYFLVEGKLERIQGSRLYGWAWDPSDPHRPVDVEIRVDGRPMLHLQADILRGDLFRKGVGNGRHGFQAVLPAAYFDGKRHEVQAWVSGGDAEAVQPLPGEPLEFVAGQKEWVATSLRGKVDGYRGGFIRGWATMSDRPEHVMKIEVVANGVSLAEGWADDFRGDVRRSGNHPTGFCAFRVRLSEAALISGLRQVHVYADGHELMGSPLPLEKVAEGLRQTLKLEASWPGASITLPDVALASGNHDLAVRGLLVALAEPNIQVKRRSEIVELLLRLGAADKLLSLPVERLGAEDRLLVEWIDLIQRGDFSGFRSRIFPSVAEGKLPERTLTLLVHELALRKEREAADLLSALF